MPSQLQVGDVIDAESGCRYEILAKLGEGGMAEVYRARARKPTGLELEVALKCLRGILGEEEESERQFIAEARVSSSLSHPNIARASDLERIDGRLYLVLEYVDGVSLKAVIRAAAERKDPMPAEFVCYVGACVADALHHANTLVGPSGEPLGIVHRDLTASNVMVTKRGVPKLLDFGIAYARIERERTRTGVVRGTYSYLSPEQAAAGRAAKGEVDGRSDLFSLGLLLVELLTGEKVFKGEDEYLTVRAIQECSPARVQEATKDLPADLQRACRRLLARRPADRYQSGEDLAFELRAILADREPLYGARECVADLAALGLVQLREGETTSRTSSGRTSRRARARRWAMLVVAALAVGAGAGALAVRLAGQPEARSAGPPLAQADRPAPETPRPVSAAADPAPGRVADERSAPLTAPPRAQTGPAQGPARAATPEELGWPGGVPVRKRQRPEPKTKDTTKAPPPPVAPTSAAPPDAATPVIAGAPAEVGEGRGGAGTQTALIKSVDRGIVANASATLPRGTVLRVKLSSSITTEPGGEVSAVVTEDVAAGNVVVPRGAVVTCHAGGTTNGRLNLSCETARAGERVWTFSSLALGEGDKTGLRIDRGGVQAGTTFAVYVTAAALLE